MGGEGGALGGAGGAFGGAGGALGGAMPPACPGGGGIFGAEKPQLLHVSLVIGFSVPHLGHLIWGTKPQFGQTALGSFIVPHSGQGSVFFCALGGRKHISMISYLASFFYLIFFISLFTAVLLSNFSFQIID